MVFDELFKFKSLIPLQGRVTVDDGFDQLNRGFMVVLLCVFGAVVTVRNYAGKEILCHGFKKVGGAFAEDYCWTQGLYTVREAYDKPQDNVPYPGVIPYGVVACQERELVNGGRIVCPPQKDILPPTRIHHLWYQWVPFYFFTAAMAFHLPYLVYKALGFAELKPLLSLLENPIADEADMSKLVGKATTWLAYKLHLSHHSSSTGSSSPQPLAPLLFLHRHHLYLVTAVTKCSYLIISVLVLHLTGNMFELADYTSYGIDWLRHDYRYYSAPTANNSKAATSARDRLFPKMVSCEVKWWGASGIEKEHGMCLLAPNVINQYLFLILWFSLVTVIATNCLSILVTAAKLPLIELSYRSFLASAFIKDSTTVRNLYMNVGTSGRITLHLLATGVRSRLFESIVMDLARKLADSQPPPMAATPRDRKISISALAGNIGYDKI